MRKKTVVEQSKKEKTELQSSLLCFALLQSLPSLCEASGKGTGIFQQRERIQLPGYSALITTIASYLIESSYMKYKF